MTDNVVRASYCYTFWCQSTMSKVNPDDFLFDEDDDDTSSNNPSVPIQIKPSTNQQQNPVSTNQPVKPQQPSTTTTTTTQNGPSNQNQPIKPQVLQATGKKPVSSDEIDEIKNDAAELYSYAKGQLKVIDGLQVRIDGLNDQIDERDNEIGNLNDDIKNLNADLIKEKAKSAKVTNARDALQKDLNLVIAELTTKNSEINALQSDLTTVTNQRDNFANEKYLWTLRENEYKARIQELIDALKKGGLKIPKSKYKNIQSFFSSEPLTIDAIVTHQQLSSALRHLGFKGKHQMELHTGNDVIRVPHVHMTTNPVTQEACYATLFDKNTIRHYGASEATADSVPLRRETVTNRGQMQVIVRDEMGTPVFDRGFDYEVNVVENQKGYRINAGPVSVYMNDLGAGTLKLKMICVDAM